MKIGITCYPTYGGSGVVATELGLELGAARARRSLHFLRATHPAYEPQPHIHYHEVEVSRYPLFDYPPTISRSRPAWRKWPNSTNWIFCTCITRSRTP